MTNLELRVVNVSDETPSIRKIELVTVDLASLPAYTAGAHLAIDIPSIGIRKYSLVNGSPLPGATTKPLSYSLGVRLDVNGGGGSRHMHRLRAGDTVIAAAPANDFPLKPNDIPPLLIGGGIGITPLISMAAELKSKAQSFKIIYAVKNRAETAFLEILQSLAGDNLEIHIDQDRGHLLDVEALLVSLTAAAPVYMCGPKPMLKVGVTTARKLGWPKSRLMFELFYSAATAIPASRQSPPVVDDGSFEVEIKNSGKVFRVPPEKSILDVLIEAGLDPMHDCKRGECGVCLVNVISGIPEHRDSILSASERATNSVMQICISRSKSPKLILDL
jgi:ferredoxin-NADP reductase